MGGLLVFISVLGGIAAFGLLGVVLGPIIVATTASLLELYAPACSRWKQRVPRWWEVEERRARVAPFRTTDETPYGQELQSRSTRACRRINSGGAAIPRSIPFETTAQIEPTASDMGQERALRALRMGVELTASGYNLFVCGLSGTSRGGMIVRMIEDMHPQTEPAPDRCYVNNFKNADRPRLLTLPRGLANAFKKEVESGIDFLRRRIPQVFEGEPFQRQKTRIVERFTVREKELMDDFTRRIAREQFALGRMQVGAVALPEIFPVLEGQMVPDRGNPQDGAGREARKHRRGRTRAQIRPVPPGIHDRLPPDAFALARTRERNELPRAGSRFRAGGRRDRGAQGKIRQPADFRVSRRGPPPHPRQSRSLQGTRGRGRTAAFGRRRRPAPGAHRARSVPHLRRQRDSGARRTRKVPGDFRDDSHLRESFRHGASQLRPARRHGIPISWICAAARFCAPTADSW